MPTKKARIVCVDLRGPQAYAQEEKAYNFTVVGGSLLFVSNPIVQESTLFQLRTINQVANQLEVLEIEDHWDSTHNGSGCAAYNALLKDDSQAAHEVYLRKARAIIIADPQLAHLDVRLHLRDLDTGEVTPVSVETEQLMEAAA